LTNETLAGKEVFRCPTPAIARDTPWFPPGRPACGTVVARDGNAAVAILARAVVVALDPAVLTQQAQYLDEFPAAGTAAFAAANAAAAAAAAADAAIATLADAAIAAAAVTS
jgi:hypothetical protein